MNDFIVKLEQCLFDIEELKTAINIQLAHYKSGKLSDMYFCMVMSCASDLDDKICEAADLFEPIKTLAVDKPEFDKLKLLCKKLEDDNSFIAYRRDELQRELDELKKTLVRNTNAIT